MALSLSRGAVAAEEAVPAPQSVSVYSSSLTPYPDAECTRIRVWLRNSAFAPIGVMGVELDGARYLDAATFDETAIAGGPAIPRLSMTEEEAGTDGVAEKKRFIQPDGAWQSHRVLPNPIPPESVGEIQISLYGIVKRADLNIRLDSGKSLPITLEESQPALRLSQIAFDPADPGKVYVYCENKTSADIALSHVLVGGEEVPISRMIPANEGGVVPAGAKACLIALPQREFMTWGRYAAIGVAGQGGEKAISVVRVMNVFPVNAWDYDTRAELFFDRADMKGESRRDGREWPKPSPGRPWRVHCTQRDINAGAPWNRKVKLLLLELDKAQSTPGSPIIFANIIEDVRPANAACFGDLTDLLMLNAFRTRTWGSYGNSHILAKVRPWVDPRPIMVAAEAFTVVNKKYWERDLTPEELRCAVWLEIAEGSKGLSYYRRMGNPAAGHYGYSSVPALEREIGRLNLDLQLLKRFLRIGDTFAGLASAKNGFCKAILCGEEGIFVLLHDRDSSMARYRLTRWPIQDPPEATITVPAGLTPARLYRVDHGFTETPFDFKEGTVFFRPEPFTAVAPYFLLFESGDLGPGMQMPSPREAAPFAEAIPDAVVSAYRSRLAALTGELLDPAADVEKYRLISLGLDVAALRKAALQRLDAIEAETRSGGAEVNEGLRTALAAARDELGASRR